MGHSLYSCRPLQPPLLSVEERYAAIPPRQTLSVQHRRPRIVYFLEGNIELELPDGSKIALKEGDALFLALPWVLRYRSLLPEREVRNHVLILTLHPLGGKSGRRRKSPDFQSDWERLLARRIRGFRYFPGALHQGMSRQLILQLRAYCERKEKVESWKASCLCFALISELLEPVEEPVSEPECGARGEAAVKHARDFIVQHCQDNLTLSQIAWQVRLSGEHLERLFKKHAGTTVFAYLDQVRIEKARQLLRTTEWPVAQVAALCGYSSSSLLGRHFKAKVKMTPMAYRLQARSREWFSPSHLQST